MAWYSKIFGRPTTPSIGGTFSGVVESDTGFTYKYIRGYEEIEIVNRAVNMIVDDCASLDVSVGDGFEGVVKGIKKVTLTNMLNIAPNPYQDVSDFRRRLFSDYILHGNIYIHFDGFNLYNLPAEYMSIEASKTEYIKRFIYQESSLSDKKHFTPDEVIHIRENGFSSRIVGTSRLKAHRNTMETIMNMKKYQNTFFKNSAIPGLIVTSEHPLSPKLKEAMMERWAAVYNPAAGGKRPLILDMGMKVDKLTGDGFRELEFQEGMKFLEYSVLKGIGVPPILLDSGNNANLRPNMRLYYLETILPIVEKFLAGLQRYFGYRIKPDIADVPALQPELQESANFYSTLVNGGIFTPNEAREDLNRESLEGLDEVRIPANVAGSAANPGEGGRPEEGGEEEDDNGSD